MAYNNHFVLVSQEFGKGSLHQQKAPQGWPPNMVLLHGRQVTGAVGWGFYWSCQHRVYLQPLQHSSVKVAGLLRLHWPPPEQGSQRLEESYHGLFWPSFGNLWSQSMISMYSIGPRSHKSAQMQRDTDLRSQWEECQKVWVPCFTTVTMVLSVFAFSIIFCR